MATPVVSTGLGMLGFRVLQRQTWRLPQVLNSGPLGAHPILPRSAHIATGVLRGIPVDGAAWVFVTGSAVHAWTPLQGSESVGPVTFPELVERVAPVRRGACVPPSVCPVGSPVRVRCVPIGGRGTYIAGVCSDVVGGQLCGCCGPH